MTTAASASYIGKRTCRYSPPTTQLCYRDDVHPEIAALIDMGRGMSGLEYAASRARAAEARGRSPKPRGAGPNLRLGGDRLEA